MSLRVLTCCALALVLAQNPALAAEKPPISLAKTTKWEMRYNEDSCQLTAGFGADNDNVIFSLTREQPGDAFDLQLYGKPMKYNGIGLVMTMTMGTGKPFKWPATALTAGGKDAIPLVRMANIRLDGWSDPKHPEAIPVITPPQERAITSVGFRMPGGKPYRLETGSLGAPFDALRTCVRDLVKSWGYDPDVEAGISRRVASVGSPGAWLHSSDYPNKALLDGHNGLIRFRLDVAPDGVPTGCRVLYRTNPDDFADLSCRLLMKRARFVPALDKTGQPVKSFYINTIRWVAGGSW